MLTTLGKLGRFLLLVGILLLVLFYFSDLSHDPEYSILLVGLLTSIIGVLLMRGGRIPSKPSGRFRIFRAFRKRPSVNDKDAQDRESSSGVGDSHPNF
jgi:hypothetical protein